MSTSQQQEPLFSVREAVDMALLVWLIVAFYYMAKGDKDGK